MIALMLDTVCTVVKYHVDETGVAVGILIGLATAIVIIAGLVIAFGGNQK